MQPLDRDHLVLELRRLAHRPLEETGQADEEDERRAEQPRVAAAAKGAPADGLGGDRGEGADDEQGRADEVEPQAEPG